jgi:hypothetical protein
MRCDEARRRKSAEERMRDVPRGCPELTPSRSFGKAGEPSSETRFSIGPPKGQGPLGAGLPHVPPAGPREEQLPLL